MTNIPGPAGQTEDARLLSEDEGWGLEVGEGAPHLHPVKTVLTPPESPKIVKRQRTSLGLVGARKKAN